MCLQPYGSQLGEQCYGYMTDLQPKGIQEIGVSQLAHITYLKSPVND